MAYTTINKPEDYFNTKLYTGTGATHNITGVGFQPDWVWLKRRDNAGRHRLFDAVRGATKSVRSDDAEAEITRADSLTSFDSDGFTLGADSSSGGINVNISGETMVGWSWLGGGTASSNTDGSITSSVSANTTSGFSIVSYTGNGSSGSTVGHGLGATPAWIIVKNRDQTDKPTVFHQSLTNGANSYLELSGTNAESNLSLSPPMWGTPSSTTFGGLHFHSTNASGEKYIAYCFAEKKGFSKFGSYTGNGSTDGPMVYTGFKPAWVLQKNTSVAQGWQLQDNKRLGYNPDNYLLQPHTEQSESALQRVDLLSNGFKVRTTDAGQNASGNNYIYMAFAEHPFVSSTGVPTTAR